MKPTTTILIGLLAASVLTPGCQVFPQRVPAIQSTSDPNFEATWDAAIRTLGRYRFNIDRADRREGVITTFPMVGRHWFEFWRRDAATARDVAEASLHQIYRQATVTIRRTGAAGPASATAPATSDYHATVEVHCYRSDRPKFHVTNTSEAYEMFIDPNPERGTERAELGSEVRAWMVALGRDQNLEKTIERKIGSLAATLRSGRK